MLGAVTLQNILNAFLLVYAALFPIVNPIGSAPLFLRMTRGSSPDERRALALSVARNSFFLLLGSLFIGSHVLVFFGITLPVVRIAGGIVVAAFGWQLLHQGDDIETREHPGPRSTVDAFYPLTMPLTVGPGSISVAITLGANPSGSVRALVMTLAGHAAGLAIVALAIYFVYSKADVVLTRLGRTGGVILARLSAFILLCIGVQIVWNGVRALVATL